MKYLVALALMVTALFFGSSGTWAFGAKAPVNCANCDGGGGMPACGSNTLGMTYDSGGVRYYCLWTAQSGFVWARL
jgi:hypothetical protein